MGPELRTWGWLRSRTLCFSFSSLLNGALMISLRSLEGAPWWALRDFRRDEASTVGKIESQLAFS